MRLLFDEPLSERLIVLLHDLFPESAHVRQMCGEGASDRVVWEFARQHGCLVVTKDEDFHRLSVLRGAPPKWCGFAWGTAGRRTSLTCYAGIMSLFVALRSRMKRHS